MQGALLREDAYQKRKCDVVFRFARDSPLEGADLPPMIKRKKRGNNPEGHCRDAVPLGERSTVPALSRTLCAGLALSSFRFEHQEGLHPIHRSPGFPTVNPRLISRCGCLS
jgi:hypothetical protein